MSDELATTSVSLVMKKNLESLLIAIDIDSTSKVKIKELGQAIGQSIKDPVRAHVGLVPLMKLMEAIKEELDKTAVELAENTPESLRSFGLVKYDVRTRININYDDDPTCAEIKKSHYSAKELVKAEVNLAIKKKEDHPLLKPSTKYIVVSIPKE